MNYIRVGRNNLCLLIIALIFFSNIMFAKLPVYFDYVRFLTDNGDTRIEITYQVNNNELSFQRRDNKFIAQINVNLEIYGEQGNKLGDKNFSKMITANNERDTCKEDRFFIDKIAITVRKGTYHIIVNVIDEISQNRIKWDKKISVLKSDKNMMEMSDIELNSFISEDTTETMRNFRRDNTIYLVNPGHIYNIDKFSKIFYYYEFYYPQAEEIIEEIEIVNKNREVIVTKKEKIVNLSEKNIREASIDIDNLTPEEYFLRINLTSNEQEIRKEENIFLRKGEKSITYLYNIDKEFRYLKYLITREEKRFWNELNITGKQTFIRRFWERNDPNPFTDRNEFRDEIISRFDYANENFAYYGQGWNTDRGRIYIRNGAPDEIREEVIKFETRPFKIWKYYSGRPRIYIFVDFTGDRNYRLVYSENDDRETNDPNWRDYLGSDFNMDDLK